MNKCEFNDEENKTIEVEAKIPLKQIIRLQQKQKKEENKLRKFRVMKNTKA